MEKWKNIPGYEGCFKISTYGRIKSLERIYFTGRGAKRRQSEIILKLSLNSDGYFMVSLGIDGIRKTYSVHRLVAMAFIPNINAYETVNHKNGNKKDNRVENLEWCSKLDNNRHAQDNGLIPYKLSGDEISDIIKKYNSGNYRQSELAEMYNVNQGFISRIVHGKRRKRGLSKINKI